MCVFNPPQYTHLGEGLILLLNKACDTVLNSNSNIRNDSPFALNVYVRKTRYTPKFYTYRTLLCGFNISNINIVWRFVREAIVMLNTVYVVSVHFLILVIYYTNSFYTIQIIVRIYYEYRYVIRNIFVQHFSKL